MSNTKLRVMLGKYESRKLCYQGDEKQLDIMEDVSTQEAHRNLDEIARRWNNHDALLKACEIGLERLDVGNKEGEESEYIDKIKEAIAQAEEVK